MVAALRTGVWRLNLVARQIVAIGYGSQVVVIVTGGFRGGLCLPVLRQVQAVRHRVQRRGDCVGGALPQLGPVLAGLMVAGGVGAAMAADIGTMKVTEQIDALRVMGVHPVDYLVLPRFLAMLVSMPLLVAECIGFGLLAAHLLVVGTLGVPDGWFWQHTNDHTEVLDVGIGMFKGLVFGILITLISCQQGLMAEEGAVGVGRGTTRAVVYSSLTILISNFFLSIALDYVSPMSGS